MVPEHQVKRSNHMPVIFQHILYNIQHVHTVGGFMGLGFTGVMTLAGLLLLIMGIYNGFFKHVGSTSVADLGPAFNAIGALIQLLLGVLCLFGSWTVLSMFYSS